MTKPPKRGARGTADRINLDGDHSGPAATAAWTEEEDLYVVLGLPAYPQGKSCEAAAIKKAYYKLALQYHPGTIMQSEC
jgi:hypothetical protein